MPNVDKSWLQKIINDSGSTDEERSEAQRQLEEVTLSSQADEDKIIARYLDRDFEAEEWSLVAETTVDTCHSLCYWALGLELERMDFYIDLAVALHGRTLSADIKARCREAVNHWQKLAQHYRNIPASDKAIRHASRFLDALVTA